MRNITLSMILLLIATGCVLKTDPSVEAAHQEAIRVAGKTAAHWLALFDAGKYEECWDVSSSTSGFKPNTRRDEWAHNVARLCQSLGSVIARSMEEARYHQTPALGSDPDTIVFTTRALFAQNRQSKETIILTLDKDGQWRVRGYRFQPVNFQMP